MKCLKTRVLKVGFFQAFGEDSKTFSNFEQNPQKMKGFEEKSVRKKRRNLKQKWNGITRRNVGYILQYNGSIILH